MTTFSAVSSVAERLNNLLRDEARMGDLREEAGDLREEAVQLISELYLMKNKMVSDEDESEDATQLAYDIEDAVESFVGGQADPVAISSTRIVGSSRQFIYSYLSARSLRKKIPIFNKRIGDLKNQSITAKDADTKETSSTRATLSTVKSQQNRYHSQQVYVEEAERLRSLLVGDEEPKLSIIAICGVGGIGKTTLAKLLYNDPSVRTCFKIHAWATVGMEFQATDILEAIFSLYSAGNKLVIAGMETIVLMEQLHKIQKGNRYLVVLDDIWSLEAWETLRFAFPDDNNGSRIVITTRDMDLANRITQSVIQMKLLTDDESWDILKLRSDLVDNPEGMPVIRPKMEEIGRQIVKHSRGLPLAITLIGSTLRMKNLEEWEQMLHILPEDQASGAESALAFSYKHLPIHLKPCFLYLGHFSKDEGIPVEKLYLLWMAEGLIQMTAENSKTLMEVAEDYLSALVDRSLVFVVENEDVSAYTRFKSCQLHDLIREFCISKGKTEKFFEVIDFKNRRISNPPCRRLAIYLNEFEDTKHVVDHTFKAKHIRSILFFDTDDSLSKPAWPREVSDLTEFQGTRVLEFDGVDFGVKKLPKGIQKLFYLRHLSFQGCYLQDFPSCFGNFPFLETLDLRVRVPCTMTIPNVLWKMSSLRHLFFPLAFRGDTKDKLKLNTLKNLQVLENFNAALCDTADLQQLKNLQILTGILDGNNIDLENIIKCMNENISLRHSVLVVTKCDSYSEEKLSLVAALLECNALHCLDIEGHLGLLHKQISSNFTSIIFNGSEFSEDPIPVLGKLPNLRSLVLCNNAFVGKNMVCSEFQFPQLTSLKLASLPSLEKWEVDGSMPNLTVITIEQCNKLKLLPSGLLQTLQKVMIGLMPKEFQDQVKKMIKEQRDLGNEKLIVTFYDC